MRIEGRAFFLNAQLIGEKIRHFIDESKPSVLLIDCSSLIDLEYTALKMLIEREQQLRRDGVELWLAALNPQALAIVQRSTIGDTLGRSRMFFNRQAAVEQYERRSSAAESMA